MDEKLCTPTTTHKTDPIVKGLTISHAKFLSKRHSPPAAGRPCQRGARCRPSPTADAPGLPPLRGCLCCGAASAAGRVGSALPGVDALWAPFGIGSARARPLPTGNREPASAHGTGTSFLACTSAATRVNSAQSQHLFKHLDKNVHKPSGLCAKETPRATPPLTSVVNV